ncbi:hypothetical protein QVD17_05200 [Tagetes erecta]|uniref:UvrD-like helicase ATP-binding domain-containing protein n=1 Tax=Tagetes erecta TaxID=13708 RepID=A0AAD8PAC2_TARER|nr:hypothetical protein QVD17_05200 [Tagetes erecta]
MREKKRKDRLLKQEKNVVSFDKSSFIIGRSGTGTGKTTVLTMKLFQSEQLHHIASEGFHEAKQDGLQLHQLFVTFSSKRCYAVRKQFGEWKRLTCGGGSSSPSSLTRIDDVDQMMLSEDIPDQLIHLPQDAYPLIITFQRFLLMLDGTVGTSYFARFPNVMRMMISRKKTNTSRLSVLEHFMKFHNVTYELFCLSYWPFLNRKLTINLDPSTVYTEIMSVIKGGLLADKAPNGILPKDDYVALCDGWTSVFDAQKREIIYSIFLQYDNLNVVNGHFDLADLVNDLHQRLEVEGYTGDIMDYVYVDEVQDLSMRQILLFKYVCPNVHKGFAFSGDTAQAIAKGIGFRFEDIRCLFFKKFLLGSEKGNVSKMFQLSENFRTHTGVLNLAQSVINLLCHFSPLFVDALRPETSLIGGDLPILLETDVNNNAIKFIFERTGNCSQLITGFGAEQVVLVRDESLREKVFNIVGKKAIILTIMESKGLEFQDVLLYDFFTTSAFSNEWRIIYTYMKDKDLLNLPFTTLCSCFDMQKHAVLCSELKQLYVAITRTRQRLWICESAGFSEPIYDYWKKLSLVEVKHLNDSFADTMQVPSSKDEWRSRGIKLFCENNFRMAQMCFLKAGDEYHEKLAEAYHLRAIAGNTRTSQPERKKLLKDAAELFKSIGKKELAADCYYEIEDYVTAGYIYKSESMLEKAGDCFYLARCYELAVEEYKKVGAFAKCLSACADGNLFETGFKLVGRWGECEGAGLQFLRKGARYYFTMKDFNSMMKFVRSFGEKDEMRSFLSKRRFFDELILLEKEWENFEEAEKVMHKGAHYYFSVKDFDSMMKFVHSFNDKGDMRCFLTENKCYDELILLEKEWGNFHEAAKAARMKPDPVLEADLLRKAGLYRESSLVILWHVFSNSTIFKDKKKPFTQKDELLRLAVSTARRDSNVFYQFVCQEGSYLSVGETWEELLENGLEFIYCYKENVLDMGLEWVKTRQEIRHIEKSVIDMMRSFLESVNRQNELILLDEICGEFVEAAKIGTEDEHSLEATMSRLWYVFFGSLWAYGRRAWPLKDFNHKDKLLDDANSYVIDHPDSPDAALVRTEIHVLSGEDINLSQMWRYLRETPKERSLRVHFLISRRILEVHIRSHCKEYASILTPVEDALLENKVSVEGLIYFWNYWKEMVCELINWSHAGGQTSKIYEDFIFNYFGVRKYDVDKYGGYVVLDAEAQWVKGTRANMIRNGYLYIIHACQFSSVVSQHWYSELLFVTGKVFAKIQSLYVYSPEKGLSIHQLFKAVMGLFEVVKSLQKCESPNSRKRAAMIVDKYFHPWLDQFLLNVGHNNWKDAQSKEMICMKRNEAFLNMLEETININIKSLNSRTCGQLGRIAAVFLGYKLMGYTADTERTLRCSQNWRDLFRTVMNADTSVSKNEDLAIRLHNVLKETFSAGWQRVNECMSPACFLYLMDRLLILSFCFRRYVFTTRSSCAEWLSNNECRRCSNGGYVTNSDTVNNIYDHSLTLMVCDMLNSEDELMKWLRRSNEPECWYPVLLLRLTVLLSLLCVNSGLHYDKLYHQLERGCFVSLLPHEFYEALINGISEGRLVDSVAVACKIIDDPLVVMSSKEDFPQAQCQNAKFLNMEKLELGSESLIEMLYVENSNDADRCSGDHEGQEPKFPF